MTISVGTITGFTPGGNANSPQSQALTLGSGIEMLVVTTSFYDTSSTDGIISGITWNTTENFLEGTMHYDATCGGHVSIWYLLDPSPATSNVIISYGGTLTDFTAQIIEVNGTVGTFEVDVVATPTAGIGGLNEPYTGDMVTSAASIMFGSFLDDETVGSQLSLTSLNSTSIYIFDAGSDTVGSAYREETVSGTYAITWENSAQDQDWTAVGIAFKEATAAQIFYQSNAGATTSSGTLSTIGKFKKLLEGLTTSAGNLIKKTLTSLVGAMSSDGAVTKKMFELLDGVLTSSGLLTAASKFSQALSGAMASDGVVALKTKKLLSGILTSSGTVAKKMQELLSGAMTSAGVLTPIKLAVIYYQSIAGAMSSAGTIKKLMFESLSGSTTSAGTLSKKMWESFVGSMTSSGILTPLKLGVIYYKSIVGAMSSSGDITRKIFKSLVGTLTSSGYLNGILVGVTIYYKSVAGALSSEGSLTKRVSRILSGAMTSSGLITKKILKSLSGVMDSSGIITYLKKMFISLSGTTSSSGEILRKIKISFSGAMTSVGTIRKKMFKSLSGIMTSIGNATGLWQTGIVLSRTIVTITDTEIYIINIEDEGHT